MDVEYIVNDKTLTEIIAISSNIPVIPGRRRIFNEWYPESNKKVLAKYAMLINAESPENNNKNEDCWPEYSVSMACNIRVFGHDKINA